LSVVDEDNIRGLDTSVLGVVDEDNIQSLDTSVLGVVDEDNIRIIDASVLSVDDLRVVLVTSLKAPFGRRMFSNL
jgi:hypothetical protein